jgi:phytanoyl-CoA hydroxylase
MRQTPTAPVLPLSSSSAGERITVYEDSAADDSCFNREDLPAALSFYRQHGCTVLRSLIPRELCDRIQNSLATEVKPYGGLLPRINGRDEINQFNENGFLLNSLMNVQSRSKRLVPHYTANVLAVLTHDNLKKVLETHFGNSIGLKTWNHIEANPVTQPHYDCHFWADDMAFGEVVGAWIALEDIHEGAGRLYVYPESHTRTMQGYLAASDQPVDRISPTDPQYQKAVADMAKFYGWKCVAPALRAGDVLLWDSMTIHGSLTTTTPQYSRSSLTSHFSSARGRFIRARTRRTPVNGVAVSYPKFNLKDFLGLGGNL